MSHDEVYAQLVHAMSDSRPTSAILRVLSQRRGSWAALATPTGHLIEDSPHGAADRADIEWAAQNATPQNRFTATFRTEDGTTLSVAAVGRDRRPAALLVVPTDDQSSDEHRLILGAASLLAQSIREFPKAKAASRVIRECVTRMIFNGHVDSAAHLAADLGLAAPPSRSHVACIRGLEAADVDSVLDTLESGLPRGHQQLLAFPEGQELWMLIAQAQEDGALREAQRLHRDNPTWTFLYTEAVKSAKIPVRREAWARAVRRAYPGALIDVSRTQGQTPSDWVKMLEIDGGLDVLAAVVGYLRHRGRWEAAADGLSIHRNTLRYRISTAQKLIGVDLEDPDVSSRLWLALRDAGWTT